MPPKIPTSTYRLQLNHTFTLYDAAAIVDYLAQLGVGACYTSPLLAARSGSLHGYDVIDHTRVNPELGGDEALGRFAEAVRARDLGVIVDIVPNHMCVAGGTNQWWQDVLENGPSSPYATFFDIDWHPPKPDLMNKVLLPVLGKQYGRALEEDLSVSFLAGGFVLNNGDIKFPLAPRSWLEILRPTFERLKPAHDENDPDLIELQSIITALTHLPERSDTDVERMRERHREKEVTRRRLAALAEQSASVREGIEATVTGINGRRGEPHSFDDLERLLEDQAYRLSHWRVASDEINYRRFFDVNDLAAIRVELPEVFAAVHDLPLRWVREGWVTGFRIDHVDGLLEPKRYLMALQSAWAEADTAGAVPTESVDPSEPRRAGYIVVEKILGPGEPLPASWPTHGTTGYEFIPALSGLFVDATAERRLRDVYRRFAEDDARFADVVYRSKRLVLASSLSAELTVLSRRLDRISEQHRYSRDFTLNSLQHALGEVIACFPVYRTYVAAEDTVMDDWDKREVSLAIRQARRRNPTFSGSLFDFIQSVLMLEPPDGLSPEALAERRNFVLRFQQLTAPVTAKGIEDTAFYRWTPLAALNEVGGEPERFGISIDEFHRRNEERARRTPNSLLATATHDTKRGEDTRLRILALSEIPTAWERAVRRWRDLNQPLRKELGGTLAPTAAEEYFFYQTLVGAWPIGGLERGADLEARLQAYMEKALKEAKVNTSWIEPDQEHEAAVQAFITNTLDPTKSRAFISDFARFHRRIEWAAYWTSLAQALAKITSPGVPDFYQGSELWDLSLVDPDNRRPVDYALRRRFLGELQAGYQANPVELAQRLLAKPHDGRIKLFVIARALAFRRAQAALFAQGGYEALAGTGARGDQVVAFRRTHGDAQAVVVFGRFFTRFEAGVRRPVGPEAWAGTAVQLPRDKPGSGRWYDVLTGAEVATSVEGGAGTLPVSDVLAHYPVALLSNTPLTPWAVT